MTSPIDQQLFGQVGGVDAEEENPQEQQSPTPEFGPNNIELPEELQNALYRLMLEAQEEDLYQRRVEVMRDRRNRFYERGIQHIYEDVRAGLFVQGQAGAWVPDPSGEGQIQCSSYIDDYNIFGRCLQIIIAKLTENMPGIDFQPDSGDNAVDLQAAQAAEAYRLLYDRRNDCKNLLTAIVRMMGLSGRTVTWTRTIADKQRWGVDQNGQPRRCQTTTVYGTLETKVPILAKSLSDCPYCIITEDPHILMAKMEHPEFADKISDSEGEGQADQQFERLARIGALQGSVSVFQATNVYANYCERKYFFFRPAMLMHKSLDNAYQDGLTLRDALNQIYPEGGCATFVGKQYVGSLNVCMDDQLAVDFPYAGDGLSRMAIMDPAVTIQDRFNDDMNAYAEVKDFGWPSTWINGENAEIAAINDQTASPYAFRALKASRDTAMVDMFYREPNPEIPASFMQHTEYLATQLMQFILAIPSAVQGAGMPDQKTASGYNAALQQAMGQLGVIWGAVQRLMAKVYRQAALAASKDDQEESTLVIPSPKGAVTLNMADLGKGHFLSHPDTDSNYPESTIQKRATLQMVFDLAIKDPAIAAQLLQSPDNWDFIFRTFGIPELVIPEAESRRKQLAEIELLLQQGPQPPSEEEMEQALAEHAAQTMAAEATGQPAQPFNPASVPMKSSVPVQELDYHDWEFEECREFLSNWPKVQQQIAAGNQAGIENVRLHAMEHQQFIAQAAAQQQQAAMQMQAAQGAKPAAKKEEAPNGR